MAEASAARCTDMSDGFGGRHFPGRWGRFLPGKGFERAGDHLFGRVVAACAEVGRDELLTVSVEGEGERRGSA